MKLLHSWRTRNFLGIFLLATALVAPAVERVAEPAAKPDAQSGLRADRWLADAKYLASDELKGRGDGMPGLDKAADYIAREFARAGLKPVQNSWFQPFKVTVGAGLGSKNNLATTKPKKHDYKLKRDFIPLPFSATAETTAPMVFVGYGIVAPEYNYDDYLNVDVRGKVVLVLRHEPQEADDSSVFRGRRMTRHAEFLSKAVLARNRGAVALVVVNDPVNHSGAEDRLLPFTQDGGPGSAGIPVIQVKQEAVSTWMATAGKSLLDIQKAIDKDLTNRSFAFPDTLQVHVAADIKKREAVLKNVVGVLPGNDPALRDQAIIIGGHYDHLGLGDNGSMSPQLHGQIHHGADDNASGTAGVLELARMFASEKTNRRTFVFMAYAGEEMGLLGSAHYVENPLLPLDKMIAMLNLDMIGRAKEDKLFMGGVGTSPDFRRMVAEENVSTSTGPAPDFDIDYSDSGYDASDHMSFAKKNIPVMFFFTGLHADYHRPSDTWDKLVPSGAVRVLELTARIARRIDAKDERPQYVQVERPRRGPAQAQQEPGGQSTYGAYFGSVPDFGRSADGVRFDDVRPDSPAAKAGLKAGDILIKFDGEAVNNLYEFTTFLSGKKPGDTVPVVVRRNNQEITATVTLAERP
jgi:hypothetical protein